MKCEKAREIIATYAKHLCKGENCNKDICCEVYCWSGKLALAEIDAVAAEIAEANQEKDSYQGQLRYALEELEYKKAENKEIKDAYDSANKMIGVLQSSNTALSLKTIYSKSILFKMWESVEDGRFGSRSFVGDMALGLRSAIYENNEDLFFSEYDNYKSLKESEK